MSENTVLKAAEDAIDAAKSTVDEAKALNTETKATAAKIDKAFGPDWEQNLASIVKVAKAVEAGESLVPKKVLVEALVEINNEMEAERKARGIMVGGGSASAKVAEHIDTWNKDFDYRHFALHTGLEVATTREEKAAALDTAMACSPRSEVHKAFQHAYMDLMLADSIARAHKKNYRSSDARRTFPSLFKVCDYLRGHLLTEITGKAAIDPNDVADTADWIPTVMSPDFRELMYLELRVESLFDMIPYTGKAGTLRMPLNITNSIGHLVPQSGTGAMGTTYALSNPFATTDPIQIGTQILDSKKDWTFAMHRGRSMWQGIIDDDSPIPFLAIVRRNILLEIARASETAIINGQKSGEIDTGAPGVTAVVSDPRNSWDGLRKHVRLQTGSTFGAAQAALTVTMLMQNGPILGGKYMVNPSQGAIILSPVSLFHILTDSSVWTVEKYGPQATVHTGALASVGGKPIIVSEFLATNLNASGIYDAITTNSTSALIVHRPSFMGVEHRAIEVGVDYWRATDVNDAVGMRRLDWGKIWGNSEKSVVEITNLKTT